jgi:hypothetical protein
MKVLFRHLPGGRLRKITKAFFRLADVPTEIRTEHLPNTSEECYQYGNPFGTMNNFTAEERYMFRPHSHHQAEQS